MVAMRPRRNMLWPNSANSVPFTTPPSCLCPTCYPWTHSVTRLERPARVGASKRLLVPVPCGTRPDVEPLGDPNDDGLALQSDLIAQPLRNDQPALAVQVDAVGASEEHPRVCPGLLPGERPIADLVASAAPLVCGKGVEAPVLAKRQIDALGEGLTELR